jgi:hypothetical protein
VNREYRKVLSTHPRGPSIEDQCGGCVVTYPYHLRAAHQEVQDVFSPRVLSLVMSFEGTNSVNVDVFKRSYIDCGEKS